jgi:hypothetical protein
MSCGPCIRGQLRVSQLFGVTAILPRNHITAVEIERLRHEIGQAHSDALESILFEGSAVGKIALGSTIRFYKGEKTSLAEILQDQSSTMILRSYLLTAMVSALVSRRVLECGSYDLFLSSHGVYSDYVPALNSAVSYGVAARCWDSGYQEDTVYFSRAKGDGNRCVRGTSIHRWSALKRVPLSPAEEDALDGFFYGRYYSQRATDVNTSPPVESIEQLRTSLGLRRQSRVVTLFTHLNWDAALDYCDIPFASTNEWLLSSVEFMIADRETDWIVRVHPAEMEFGTRTPSEQLIFSEFGAMPPHVNIIPPERRLNPYSMMQLTSAGITLFGTVGVELPLMGKPVLTASTAHYTGKGFTLDSASIPEYKENLERIARIPEVDEHQVALSRRYAFEYFIRRQAQLPWVKGDSRDAKWNAIGMRDVLHMNGGATSVADRILDSVYSC